MYILQVMISKTFDTLLPPAGQGNIFRSVCQEFCSRGGGVGGGVIPACIAGGMPACLAGIKEGSPGPHPGGKLRGLARGVSRPIHGGVMYPSMH